MKEPTMSMQATTVKRLVVMGAMLLMVFASSPQVTAAGAPGAGGTAGWTRVSYDAPLAKSQSYMLQGTRTSDGGCAFSGSLELAPGEAAVTERQTGLNLATCQAEIERGVPSASSADDAAPPDSSTLSGEAAAQGDLPGSDVPLATHSAGYLKTDWEDPVQIDVNSVRDNTDWYWNGNSVVAPVYGSWHLGWYSPSGWQLVSQNWQNTYTSYQTTSSHYAHFKNPYFCATIDTHSYYDRNTVHGRNNGSLVGVWNSWVSGGCTGLLHFEHHLVRTLN